MFVTSGQQSIGKSKKGRAKLRGQYDREEVSPFRSERKQASTRLAESN